MKPSCQEIWDEVDGAYKEVHREADDSWRHGCYVQEVYHRASDDTFWSVSFELSHDAETNGFREGTADISQVKPVEKTTVSYVPVND